MEEKKVDDHLFDLPALPRKIFTASQLYSPAHYPGNNGAWLKYLQTNLDGNLALKYVKISKDQAEASQQVIVEFVVSEDGSVNNLHVINKQEVNSHLAEEAMRVIRDSPRWAPAMFFGEKITTSVKQPVIFAVKR